MKESKIILYTLLLILILVAVVWVVMPTPKIPNISMPQNATKIDGIVEVFGLKIGQSTLKNAMQIFGTEAQVALFKEKNKANEIEVYFENTKIGGLSIRVILGIEASDNILQVLNQNIDYYETMPSGREKVMFNTFASNALLNEKIQHLSFIPRVNLDNKTIIKLFGEPKIKNLDAWLYPQKGLKIVKDGELNIFEYTN